jgi:tetratricopeptide (TPR) repeat protein
MCNNWALGLVLLLVACPLHSQKADTKNSCNAPSVFEKVKPLLQSKQFEDAAKLLDQLQGCQNLSVLETFEAGWLYGRARKFATALQYFNRVPPDVPDPLSHGYAIALSKFELADYKGASEALTGLQSKGLSDAKCANLLAVSYAKLGMYEKAYDVLAQESGKNPEDLFAYLNLVTLCAEGGNLERAAEIATKTVKMFPERSEAFAVLGAAHTLLGLLSQAHEDFSNAIRLAPAKPQLRFFLALTDYKQGKFSEAIAELQAAYDASIVDSDLHYLMAECLLKIDSTNSQGALKELDRALELNGNSVSALTLRGRLRLAEGRPQEALVDLERANRQDPESRSAAYALARIYREMGRTGEANELFKRFRSPTTDTLSELSDRKLTGAFTENGAQP